MADCSKSDIKDEDDNNNQQDAIWVMGYEAGSNIGVARLWKNGLVQRLTDGSNDAEAFSVLVK